MDLMRELTRARSMSVILITHDLGMAAAYCDRIVVMQKGHIVESVPVRELSTRPCHSYTKKLIAASSGPSSQLADLTAVPDRPAATLRAVQPTARTPAAASVSEAPMLEVIGLVKDFAGMSYIFVSHDLNVVRLLCERVIVMNSGCIVESGTADAVLNAPRHPYARALVEAIPHFNPARMPIRSDMASDTQAAPRR